MEIEGFLAHYSSQYYDPAKAHEYYEKNKKLKGKTAAPLNQNQKEATSYVRNQISTKRTAELKALTTGQEATVKKLQADAKAKVAKINDQIKAFFEAQAKEILKVPDNASPKLRAQIEKSNAAASKQNNATSNSAKKAVVSALSEAIANARTDYTKRRAGIVTKYKTAQTTEDTNIRAKVR